MLLYHHMYAHLLSHDTKYCGRYERCCYITCTHIYCHMTHGYVWNDSFTSATCLFHMYDTTHSHISHDSFICVTDLHIWQEKFICVTCILYIQPVTRSFMGHGTFTCVRWIIHMCDPLTYLARKMYVRDVYLTYMRRDLFIHRTCLI